MEQYLKQWLNPAFDMGIDFEAPAAITKDYFFFFPETSLLNDDIERASL
jgi:hypothetical protein